MDKRLKHRTHEQDLALRDELHQALAAQSISIGDAVKLMQRISRLTQPEFAKHRGISTAALRQIISGTGNPTVETINKVVSIFGLEVGLVPKRPRIRITHSDKAKPEPIKPEVAAPVTGRTKNKASSD